MTEPDTAGGRVTGQSAGTAMPSIPDNASIPPEGPTVGQTDPRQDLYLALSTVEDSLLDSYHRPMAMPEFADPITARGGAAADAAGNDRGRVHATVAATHQYDPGSSIAVPENDTLEAVFEDVSRCRACRLSASRTKVVPGIGVPQPLVMVIGEGPGAEEDRTGVAFVGPAGQLLDKMLAAIGLSRQSNCFIGNIVKCRPPMNRDPAPDEQASCMPFLDRQIALLRPRAILAVGRIPAQALLGVRDGIGKLRGHRYLFRGIPLVATYHPSALLRDETLKRPAWEDLKLLKTILDGMDKA